MAFTTIRNGVATALPYVLPYVLHSATEHIGPILVKELNKVAERKKLRYRILTTATEKRRQWAKKRMEEMYYSPEELAEIAAGKAQKFGHFQNRAPPSAPQHQRGHTSAPRYAEASRAAPNYTIDPNTGDRYFQGKKIWGFLGDRPITNQEEYEHLLMNSSAKAGNQYSRGRNVYQNIPGGVQSVSTPAPIHPEPVAPQVPNLDPGAAERLMPGPGHWDRLKPGQQLMDIPGVGQVLAPSHAAERIINALTEREESQVAENVANEIADEVRDEVHQQVRRVVDQALDEVEDEPVDAEGNESDEDYTEEIAALKDLIERSQRGEDVDWSKANI